MADFAPQYSTRERIMIALKLVAVTGPVYLAGYYWLFPRLREYAQTANCDYFGDISGLQLLIYGVLVGIPLSMALLIWLIEGARSIRVWKLGQHPLPGEKVLRKTRYRYGAAARLRPLAVLAILLVMIGAAIRGGFQAPRLIATFGPCENPGQSQYRGARPNLQALEKLNW
ncbi:MAG: hypothetical protein PVI79_09585 [Gammaproteobacteria bacterium]|jgi:hypothetical protein